MVPAALGLSAEQMTEVLTAAVRAPSVHNTQPWLFHVLPKALVLYADGSRRLPATDPDDREQRLSCGAALFNLRLGLQTYGVEPLITIRPWEYPGSEAVIRPGDSARIEAELSSLWRAIPHRRTNRRPFWDDPVPSSVRQELVRAAEAERCWLTVLDASQETRLRRLLVSANRRQVTDPEWVAEFRAWTGRSADSDEGVPLDAAGPAPEDHDIWPLRDFGHGKARSRVAGKDFEQTPLIAVVATHADSEYDQVQAGAALQRVLLTATTHGLAASFMSQVIEVRDARADLKRMLGGFLHPQAVFRIGYGSPILGTRRRPVADMIIHGAPVLPGISAESLA